MFTFFMLIHVIFEYGKVAKQVIGISPDESVSDHDIGDTEFIFNNINFISQGIF